MSKLIERLLTPENYSELLKEAQRQGPEAVNRFHEFALNQGFSMDGNAVVTGIKWVRGTVQDNGVLVQGLHAKDPTQLTLFSH